MKNTGIKRRLGLRGNIVGKVHHCKICSRPMRSVLPTICADCEDKGHVEEIIKTLEDRMKKQLEEEVNSWKLKQS